MDIEVHIIVDKLFPAPGGLEFWTWEFAQRLTAAGIGATVYVCGEQSAAKVWAEGGVDVVAIAPLRALWEAPLRASDVLADFLAAERSRLNFLCVKNEISRKLSEKSDATHILVSNFALHGGYLGMLLGDELHLPHVPFVVGSDFSRGFRNARERAVLREVFKSAAVVATKNKEQAAAIDRAFSPSKIVVIPTSVKAGVQIRRNRVTGRRIRLFSDCGFSYKKGTNVLLHSFQALVEQGVPVQLELCGATESGEKAYWESRRQEFAAQFPDLVQFHGHVAQNTVQATLQKSDVYCSATLGEGSSAARTFALCSGIPIVTARCGEMDAEVEGAQHVRLASAGDAKEFMDQLQQLCTDLLAGMIQVDVAKVRKWRDKFSENREWTALIALIASVGAKARAENGFRLEQSQRVL